MRIQRQWNLDSDLIARGRDNNVPVKDEAIKDVLTRKQIAHLFVLVDYFFNILKPDISWARKAVPKDLKSKKRIEEALLYGGFMLSNIK